MAHLSADPYRKPPHEERDRRSGRYIHSRPCDGCNRPVGTDYATDDEVCGGSDGPGFFLCDRKSCTQKFETMSVEERRAVYTANRESR